MYTSMNSTTVTKKDNGLFWEPFYLGRERYVILSHEPFEVEWLDVDGSDKVDLNEVYQIIRVCKPGSMYGMCASADRLVARKLTSYRDYDWVSGSVIECRPSIWEKGVYKVVVMTRSSASGTRTFYFRVRPGFRYN